MNYENKVLNYMKDNSDSITVEELNKLNIPRITLTRLTDKKLIEYKCLIDDKVIKIMAFSKYSVIAEKFETLIETLETDTRAKDFYDIYKLMINNIDKEKLFRELSLPDRSLIQQAEKNGLDMQFLYDVDQGEFYNMIRNLYRRVPRVLKIIHEDRE